LEFVKKNIFFITIILIVFIFYVVCLSPFIQGGDTAELLLASKNFYVPHPPGYPLFILLQSLWLTIFHIKSDYWSASLFQSSMMTFSLFLILFPISKKIIPTIIILIVFFTNKQIIEAAILPDVFALNTLLITLIFYIYREALHNKLKLVEFITYPFILGFANHLTILFVLPIIIHSFYLIRKNSTIRKRFIINTIVSLGLVCILYLSLIFMNPMNYYSWGEIVNLKKLILHFLRFDYGVIKLAPTPEVSLNPLISLIEFMQNNIASIFLFIISSVGIYKFIPLKRTGHLILILPLIFSLIFIGVSNISPIGFGFDIIKRFYVTPIIIIANILGIYFINFPTFKKEFIKKALTINLTLLLLFEISQITPYVKQSNDNFFENYFKNILHFADAQKSKIIIVDNDNLYFGLRYFQSLNKKYQPMVIISPLLLTHPWFLQKTVDRVPSFRLENIEKIFQYKTITLDKDIIQPNIEKNNFFVLRNNNYKEYKMTFLPIGKTITNAPPMVETLENLNLPFPIDFKNTSPAQSFSKKYANAEYTFYHLQAGNNFYKLNKIENALTEWKKAFTIAPYCQPALNNICKLEPNYSQCNLLQSEEFKKESNLIYN
jgi:hypothetical protein